MTASDPERARQRAGLAFLAVGVALLLFAWGSWTCRTSSAQFAPPIDDELQSSTIGLAQPDGEQGSSRGDVFVRAAPMFLLVTFLLVIVFLGGSLILVRGLRQRRQAGERARRVPTPTDDIWAMQQPQDEFDEHAA